MTQRAGNGCWGAWLTKSRWARFSPLAALASHLFHSAASLPLSHPYTQLQLPSPGICSSSLSLPIPPSDPCFQLSQEIPVAGAMLPPCEWHLIAPLGCWEMPERRCTTPNRWLPIP